LRVVEKERALERAVSELEKFNSSSGSEMEELLVKVAEKESFLKELSKTISRRVSLNIIILLIR